MPKSEQITELLETIASVLLYCIGIGVVLLFFTFGMYMLASEFVYNIHGSMFGLSEHEINLLMYGWMGLLKLFVFVFFLSPWLAIKLVLKKA